jgi:hypothetical protein
MKGLKKQASQPSIKVEPEMAGIVTLAMSSAAIDEKADNE